MLGEELIEIIEAKFLTKDSKSWEEWKEYRKDIYPRHEYPINNLQITGADLIKMIKDEKIKILMGDVC